MFSIRLFYALMIDADPLHGNCTICDGLVEQMRGLSYIDIRVSKRKKYFHIVFKGAGGGGGVYKGRNSHPPSWGFSFNYFKALSKL